MSELLSFEHPAVEFLHGRLVLRLLPLPPPRLLLLLFHLQRQVNFEEVAEGATVDAVFTLWTRKTSQQPSSSHVTDRDCHLLRSGHLRQMRQQLPALAVVCPRRASCVSDPAHIGAQWCCAAARAILTLSCSWRQVALRHRSLCRFAAEVPARSYSMARLPEFDQRPHTQGHT